MFNNYFYYYNFAFKIKKILNRVIDTMIFLKIRYE